MTKVRFHLRTGRRHQLRVHAACIGHPIVGDATYTFDDCLYSPPSSAMAPTATHMANTSFPSSTSSTLDTLGTLGSLVTVEKVEAESSPDLDSESKRVRLNAERMMLHSHLLRYLSPIL